MAEDYCERCPCECLGCPSLKQQIVNLKCCGNCKLHLESCPKEWNPSDENTELIPSCGYCDQWQSDNLTRKERVV